MIKYKKMGAGAVPDFNYANTNDGTLNYKKGDIVSAVLKGTQLALLLRPQKLWLENHKAVGSGNAQSPFHDP